MFIPTIAISCVGFLQPASSARDAQVQSAPTTQERAASTPIEALTGTVWTTPADTVGLFLSIEFPVESENRALVTMPQLGIRRPMTVEVSTDGSQFTLGLPSPPAVENKPGYGLAIQIETDSSGRPSRVRWGPPAADGSVSTSLGSSDLERWIQPREFAEHGVYGGKLQLPIQAGGQTLDLNLALGHGPEGASATLSIPIQNIDAYPAFATHAGGSWSIMVNFGTTQVTFELDASGEDGDLAGIMSQAGMDMEVTFSRLSAEEQDTRPQTPKPPFPYRASEVRIPTPEGHVLAGTLLLPDAVEEPPVVVLITGSGPQDRDETVMGHKPFLVLADALARRGIASLRCDDRGVSQSTGDHGSARTTDFAADVISSVEWLRKRDDVSRRWIGLIGHSEGGVIASIAASGDPDIAFAVLMAGAGVDGGRILTSQTERIMEVAGADRQSIAQVVALHESLMDAVRDSADRDEMLRRFLLLSEAQIRISMRGLGEDSVEKSLTDLRLQVARMQRDGVSPLSEWLQAFIRIDPRSYLSRMKCPVLAINGTNDIQVISDLNLPEIDRAITTGGGDVTIIEYDGLNHLFQQSDVGAIEEYSTIRTTMEPEVIGDIADWILKITDRNRS